MSDAVDENGKILRARLLAEMREELDAQPDEGLALRKALLALIFVTATAEPAVKRFGEYLLTEFYPLSEAFEDECHPFTAEQDVRRFDNGDGAELMIHQSLVDTIMEEEVSIEEIASAGVQLSWEDIDERFVGCFIITNQERLFSDSPEAMAEATHQLRDAMLETEGFGPWKDIPEGPLEYPGSWLRCLCTPDRIHLFTRDASSRCHIMMLLAAQRLFMEATRMGFGLRGCIAQGECFFDAEKAIYAGKPLMEAQRFALQQAWFGVMLHPSMDEIGSAERDTPAPPNVEGWIPITESYVVPLQNSSRPMEFAALNWPMLFRDDPQGLDAFLTTLPHDGHYLPLYRATHAFGHEMIRRMQQLPTAPEASPR